MRFRIKIILVFGSIAAIIVSITMTMMGTRHTIQQTSDPELSLSKAREIRKFAAREIDHTADRELLLDHNKLIGQPARVGLELARTDAGGFWCGGTTVITRQLFEENGFRSWGYNHGIVGAMTHVTTLVEVAGRVYVQDSYFNFEFVRDDGTPMPLSEVIHSLDRGIIPNTITEYDYERDWHFVGTDLEGRSVPSDQYRHKGDRTIFRGALTLHFMHEDGVSKLGLDWLEERGYPRDVAFLMLFPLNLWGPGVEANRCVASDCPPILVDLSKRFDAKPSGVDEK